MGDYHYREKTCKSGQKCNQTYNYGSDAWYSDWFDPAKDILALSPFLFVCGNHEGCSRAYEGETGYERVNIRIVIIDIQYKRYIQKLIKRVNPEKFKDIALLTIHELGAFEKNRPKEGQCVCYGGSGR